MPYYLVDFFLRFRRTYCFHLQGLKVSWSSKHHARPQSREPQMSNKVHFVSEETNRTINTLYVETCIGDEIQGSCHIVICFGQWYKISRRIGCNLFLSICLCFVIAQHWVCARKDIFGMASHVNQAKYCAVLSVFIREVGNTDSINQSSLQNSAQFFYKRLYSLQYFTVQSLSRTTWRIEITEST
jgi:hypothetical protein